LAERDPSCRDFGPSEDLLRNSGGKGGGRISRLAFWQRLAQDLTSINQEYYLKTGYYLLFEGKLPELLRKPFDSFLLKTFRINVFDNDYWPDPPTGGWLLPDTWFSRINDMVRTCFVVKYLDGVQFLASQLSQRSSDAGYTCRVDYEAKEEGYYAAHFYTCFPCEIPRQDWDTRDEVIPIEMQITTQLQEVIRRLLHTYYERRRGDRSSTDLKWQWDYKSEEFGANYLGHILHYLEGMIMEVRDKIPRGQD
jgi:hypothetical protein